MKKVILTGDEFTVDFMKNNNGGKPICRIEGIVSFIDSYCTSFVIPCSTWIVRVVSIRENFLTVEPLVKVRTVKENEAIMAAKIEALKPKKKERIKIQRNYQYCSFQELRQIKQSSV